MIIYQENNKVYRCSECHATMGHVKVNPNWSFCPVCGAKMYPKTFSRDQRKAYLSKIYKGWHDRGNDGRAL